MENRDHRQGGTLPGGIERVQSIASARQFLELLRRFPAEPAFYVDFAEFLLGKHRAGLAAKSYARAAALYLTAGEALKSLGARLLSWELVAPDVSETRDAYLQLRKSGLGRGAASSFLLELPYREWVTVVSAMRVVRLPAGHMIQKFGSVEEHLFFIVSGSAQSTRFLSLEAGGASRPAEEVTLGCDDYFGSVYPLERESISASSVKSLTPVAFIRIPKTSLVDVCRRHPGVTLALERLFRSPGQALDVLPTEERRKASRRPIAIEIAVEIPPQQGARLPSQVNGISLNIGIGGLAAILGPELGDDFLAVVVGKQVDVSFSLPDQTVSMSILGRVVWARPAIVEGALRPVIGIQFTELSPQVRGYLIAFAEIARGTSPPRPGARSSKVTPEATHGIKKGLFRDPIHGL